MKITQFGIPIKKGFKILGDYEGNEKSGRVVVFSHGFGVTRTDHGMFNDLAVFLRKDFLVVRFDYNKIAKDGKSMEVFSYSRQAQMLNTVLEFVRMKFEPSEINIIAHSQGGLIVGKLQPEGIRKIIINATPMRPPYKRFKEYFRKRKGTKFDEEGLSSIPRSDGSITYINKEFWPDIKTIDPLSLFKDLSKISRVYIIKAIEDKIVIEDAKNLFQEKVNNLHYMELNGGHDFSGEAREGWLNLNKKILLNN